MRRCILSNLIFDRVAKAKGRLQDALFDQDWTYSSIAAHCLCVSVRQFNTRC